MSVGQPLEASKTWWGGSSTGQLLVSIDSESTPPVTSRTHHRAGGSSQTKPPTDTVTMTVDSLSGELVVSGGTVDAMLRKLLDHTYHSKDGPPTPTPTRRPRLFERLYHLSPLHSRRNRIHRLSSSEVGTTANESPSISFTLARRAAVEPRSSERARAKALWVCLRVTSLIDGWCEVHGDELEAKPPLADRMLRFVDRQLYDRMDARLEDAMRRVLHAIVFPEERSTQVEHYTIHLPLTTTLLTVEAVRTGRFDPNLVDVDVLASTLTVKEQAFFKKIRPRECILKRWVVAPDLAPSLVKIIDNFNTLTQWVATSVVRCTDIRRRSDMLRLWTGVGVALVDLNNYNTAMAIVGALDSSPVSRLRKTWELVPRIVIERRDELLNLFDFRRNYAPYRAAMKRSHPPVIPFIGIFTKDLFSIEEHNDTYAANGKTVNFHKMRLISRTIKDLLRYQSVCYSLEIHPAIFNALNNLELLSEREVHSLSLQCEPRKKKKVKT